jgi:predicted dinucleotide-utilizing enzyme
MNVDVVAELALQGQVQKVTVNVVNDNVESFETMHIEVRLQSLNGQTDTTITEFTTNRAADFRFSI